MSRFRSQQEFFIFFMKKSFLGLFDRLFSPKKPSWYSNEFENSYAKVMPIFRNSLFNVKKWNSTKAVLIPCIDKNRPLDALLQMCCHFCGRPPCILLIMEFQEDIVIAWKCYKCSVIVIIVTVLPHEICITVIPIYSIFP